MGINRPDTGDKIPSTSFSFAFFLHPLTCILRYRTPCSTCCTISTFFICAHDYSHGLVHHCVTQEKGDGEHGGWGIAMPGDLFVVRPLTVGLRAQLALQGELRGVSGLASLSGPRTHKRGVHGNTVRRGRMSQRQKRPLWPQNPKGGGNTGASASSVAKRAIEPMIMSIAPQGGRGMRLRQPHRHHWGQ